MKTKLKSCIVAALIVSMLLGICVTVYANPNFPILDQKIDIGGYGLYIQTQGEGKPIIILESGYGGSHYEWDAVKAGLGPEPYVVSYDRAGLGLSDASPLERTRQNMVDELDLLLEKAGIVQHGKHNKYIYVAHSMGSYNARLFAAKHPGEVKGVIFVDSIPETFRNSTLEFFEKNAPELVPFFQYYFYIGEETWDQVSVSEQQVSDAGDSLRNIPITVLTATNHGTPYPAYEEWWQEQQNQLLGLSNKVHQEMVDSAHYIQIERPDVVIDAINDMVNLIED